MVQRVDYYTLLARAVESLERDAYAARGAIYDREHKALLKRLISSAAPCTDADIAREERAFRDAIRRIEFPDDGAPTARGPQREPAEAAWPSSSRDRVRAQRRELQGEPPAQDVDRADPRRRFAPSHPQGDGAPRGRPPPVPQIEQDWSGEEPKPRRRSFLRLAAVYLLITALVLGAGSLGYGYLLGAFDLAWLAQWSGLAATPSARAVFYEGGQSGRGSTAVEGKASWGTRIQPNGPDGKPDTVVTLDVEIPEPHLAMSMVLSRNSEAGAGMSHLLELRFAKPQELPFGGIVKISNVAMKAADAEAGDALGGTGVDIAPGQFMFGLLGLPDVVQQNLQRLRSGNWLAITIVFANRAAYTLAVEKGAAGERAIDDALTKWGQ
ncbi:MAG TPA: hypothetical protein VIY51_08190 [Xanthobacteraceae bacterium]